jgi:hypothetical protein
MSAIRRAEAARHRLTITFYRYVLRHFAPIWCATDCGPRGTIARRGKLMTRSMRNVRRSILGERDFKCAAADPGDGNRRADVSSTS